MKAGDIIEWRGANKTHHGTLTQNEKGEWVVRMENGHAFSLNDLRFSRSAKLIQV